MIRGSKYPQLDDRDWLVEQYVTSERSAPDIARQLGCAPNQVSRRLHAHGIPVRGRYAGMWKPKACGTCGKQYTPEGPAQRFCSLECRPDNRTCTQCGRLFRSERPQKFCTFECLTAWRGENCTHRYVNDDGYVVIKVPPTGHRDINNNGYVRVNLGTGRRGDGRVLEHRWVMEQRLGRPLLPTEEVHHRNTVKTDNDRFCPVCADVELPQELVAGMLQCASCGTRARPNLELWDTSHPKGGRVEDKTEWALEFLARYGEVLFVPA